MERTNEDERGRTRKERDNEASKQIPRLARDDKVAGATDDCAKLTWRTASEGGPHKDESKETKTGRGDSSDRS